MTLAVLPSTTHSSVVLGPIFSFFRTSDGTETCPRLVILVRISGGLQCSDYYCKPKDSCHVSDTLCLSLSSDSRRAGFTVECQIIFTYASSARDGYFLELARYCI
jgi:hypothetical protein